MLSVLDQVLHFSRKVGPKTVPDFKSSVPYQCQEPDPRTPQSWNDDEST